MRAEIRQRGGIVWTQLQSAPDELDRFVEAVGVRRELAGDAIHLAMRRRDGEHLGDTPFELRGLVLDVGEARHQRVRLQALRIDRERLLKHPPRFVAPVVVDGELRQEDMRADV
jgi:hypothetical protein